MEQLSVAQGRPFIMECFLGVPYRAKSKSLKVYMIRSYISICPSGGYMCKQEDNTALDLDK
jgi:hypothetical protein